MATISTGGGTSAVAASAHAACARFRGTDPLITGRPRRRLAADIGYPDVGAGIPEARWMRAMTFERLVRDTSFASRVVTTAVGALGLPRPTSVVIANSATDSTTTAELLSQAHERAVREGAATLIHEPAVPFPGFEGEDATEVKPDFVVVSVTADHHGSWLIVGDAKDYERVRSRIDDARLLKGFLQVALGAEAFDVWSAVPAGMSVHSHGILAVPRNAFLQPTAVVEDLRDHRDEVRMRAAERRDAAGGSPAVSDADLRAFVAHLKATFDPTTCITCSLFSYCRHELRTSSDPEALLVELGIEPSARQHLIGLVDGSGITGVPPEAAADTVRATLTGRAVATGQRRIDPAGLPGTINVVLAKSDAAALGVYGVGLQRVSADGRSPWKYHVFADPQAQATRVGVMKLLGTEIEAAMREQRLAAPSEPAPIHLVVPDAATADILASIADNLAGIELSRLRWERDIEQGRPALTWDGEPAAVPKPLRETTRTAVSFLLEEDRARALLVRSPIVDLRAVFARHIIAGGPAVNAQRLDYVVEWARGTQPIDHREFSDAIEASEYTPGARLTNTRSDQLHKAHAGAAGRGQGQAESPDPDEYNRLVRRELEYKAEVIDVALDVLDQLPDSRMRDAYRSVEGAAQDVWRRRLSLAASDLVRFGRTYRSWRNALVNVIVKDATCYDQLLALTNPHAAAEAATDAGTRHIAHATVVSANPLTLHVKSRRLSAGSRVVLLHVNGEPCIADASVTLTTTTSAFQLSGLSIGPLTRTGIPDDAEPDLIAWTPTNPPHLRVGDRLVLAAFEWFSTNVRDTVLPINRPAPDTFGAPKRDCTPDSYAADPAAHRWCCQPHSAGEAEYSDILAGRRARGELNPEAWPPVRDTDGFEVTPGGLPVGDAADRPSQAPPENMTLDDVE